ncbi:MAG: DeoR/GlpR family DNA-binding transcription regulator [Actinomycetota bacterium]|nr:DeoR/GlpR family DNA-binding transcription regulator [Actinomycetota bacterium]
MNVEAIDRLAAIRERLEHDGRVRVADLATALGVSEMTIRRDLETLVDEGLAMRVRGGAVAVGPQPYATRYGQHARAKTVIADKLVGLVPAGATIALDASSTIQRLASRLGRARDLTVITNGPDTFRSLVDHPGVEALLTGGAREPRTGSLVGPLACRAARDLLASHLIMSAAALDPGLGSSESGLDEAEVKLAFADGADEVVLAVDSSKLGQRASARAFALERISLLVTELDPTDTRLDPYRDHLPLL